MNKLPEIDPNQAIAVDLETCDPELRYLAPGYVTGIGFIAGFAVAAKEGSFYIPVGHTCGENYDMGAVITWLNHILSGNTDKVFHNAQYDLGWLKSVGVEVYGKYSIQCLLRRCLTKTVGAILLIILDLHILVRARTRWHLKPLLELNSPMLKLIKRLFG